MPWNELFQCSFSVDTPLKFISALTFTLWSLTMRGSFGRLWDFTESTRIPDERSCSCRRSFSFCEHKRCFLFSWFINGRLCTSCAVWYNRQINSWSNNENKWKYVLIFLICSASISPLTVTNLHCRSDSGRGRSCGNDPWRFSCGKCTWTQRSRSIRCCRWRRQFTAFVAL